MLSHLDLTNFTVFEAATFRFSKRINVIHGINGCGKTHILKLSYLLQHALAARPATAGDAPPSKAWMQHALAQELVEVFRPDALGRLATRKPGHTSTTVSARFATTLQRTTFSFSTRSRSEVAVSDAPSRWLDSPPVYLPSREALSIYPNFVSLYDSHALEFDRTWRDICVLLGAPLHRGVKSNQIRALLSPIEEVLGGSIVLDNAGRFFLNSERGSIEMHLVAEGLRKLAMLARLIATGSLVGTGCLLWDEPEANLNPVLIKAVAQVLFALSAQGIQVFIATHSLFLMRELSLLQATSADPESVRYFGLQRIVDRVQVTQGSVLTDSGDIAALDEDLLQAERVLDQAMGVTP